MPLKPIPILTIELEHAYFRDGSKPWTSAELVPIINGAIVRDLRPWNLILNGQTLYYWGSGEEDVPSRAWAELPEIYMGIFPQDPYFPTYTDLPLGLGDETLWLMQPSPSNSTFRYTSDSIDQVYLKPETLAKDLYNQIHKILSPHRAEQTGEEGHYMKLIPADTAHPEWKIPIKHERDVRSISSPPSTQKVSTQGGFSVALAIRGEEKPYHYTGFDAPITKSFILDKIPAHQYPLGLIHLTDWPKWATEAHPKVKVSFEAAKVRIHYHLDLSKSEKTFHSLSFHSTANAPYRFQPISHDETNSFMEEKEGTFIIKNTQQPQVFAVVHASKENGHETASQQAHDPSQEALLPLSSRPIHAFELTLNSHTGQEYQLMLPYPDYRSIRKDVALPNKLISEIFVFV